MEKRTFYQVLSDLSRAPLRDHMLHGYEERQDFFNALRQLRDRWKDRIGECIEERDGFRHLRFHDTPGGKPDEAWLPDYLLLKVDMPDYLREMEEEVVDEQERELERALGFDW